MSAKKVEKKHSSLVDLVSGGAGGALSKTLLCPLQRIVVLKQLGEHPGKSSFDLARLIMKEGDGVKAFWRGNLTSVIQRFPYSGIQLVVYGKTKHFFQDLSGVSDQEDGAKTLASKFIMKAGAGGLAATVSGAAVYPMEVVRNRLMSGNPKFRTISGTATAVWSETNGPRNFYRGLGASLVQRVPDILINFAVYESIRYYLEAEGYAKQWCIMAGSAAAATTSIAVTFPIDVCKRRISLAGQGADKRVYSGLWHCASTVVKETGFASFYRGAGLEAARCIPQVGLMWFTIEYFRDLLEHFV